MMGLPSLNFLLKIYVIASKPTSPTSVCRHRGHRFTDIGDVGFVELKGLAKR